MLPDTWFVVVNAGVAIDTAKVFFDKKLTRGTAICTMSPSLVETGKNDCEKVVRKHYPEVAEALDWLTIFAPARLTGTGGCIFACFENVNDALDVIGRLPTQFSGFVAKGMAQSPLLESVKRYKIEATGGV